VPGPGLFFDMGLGGGAGSDVAYGDGPRYGNNPAPSTASQAAYGSGGAPVNPQAGLSPATPTGLMFAVGVASFVALVLMYRSLPG
jgi:hypothetical protein